MERLNRLLQSIAECGCYLEAQLKSFERKSLDMLMARCSSHCHARQRGEESNKKYHAREVEASKAKKTHKPHFYRLYYKQSERKRFSMSNGAPQRLMLLLCSGSTS
eukprot:6477690-Amphidinium_carterae.2